jgi:CRP-like cAMP-binding protein
LRDCLSSHFLFQRLSEEDIEYLIQIFKPITYIQHEVIVQQGDAPGYFYILASGTVIITTTPQTASGKSQRSEDLTDKYVVFGELSLLTSTPQPVTIKVTSSLCKLFRLDPADFLKITRPQHRSGQETTMEQRFQLLRHAMPLDLVAPLEEDPIAMNKLVSGMSIYTFVQGDVLYEKGAMIHSFVAVAQGQVVLSQVSMGGRDYPDIYIGPNESETSFGWLTMEEDERLAGSIVAATDGIALVIPKHVFLHALGGGNCGKTTLRQIVEKRSARIQLENVSLFQDSKLDLVQLNGLLDLMHHCQYELGAIVVERAEKVEPGMYFVREGSVTVEVKGQDTKTIEAGGYFGEKSMLLDQNKSGDKHYVKRSTMKVTARGPTTTRIDVLYLEECRKVLDTTRLGLGHSEKDDDSSSEDSDLVRWSTLKRHALLGSGSFGQVWLATSTSSSATLDNGENGTANQESPLHPHTVALKIQFKYRLVQSPDQVERIIAERNILACLDSPFLLRLYSAFQDQHRLYMVTSLLQGGELESLIPEDGLSEESAKFYAAGILEGLTYMHRKHILHRDVKTTNVLISDKGYPVLIDMGFGRYPRGMMTISPYNGSYPHHSDFYLFVR